MNELKFGKVSKILLISFIVLIVFYGLISLFSVKIEGTRKFSSSFLSTFNFITGFAVEPQIEVKLKNKYGGEVGFYDLKDGKLIFGLDDSPFNSIIYLSGEQEKLTAYLDLTSDNGISTQVISLENIDFKNAIIILEKNNPVTSIVKCASFDLGAFSCREWEKLNLEFIEDEKTIRFEVDEKGVYAGYFDIEDLRPEQIKIDIKNKYGNEIIEPNLTDQGFFVDANNSKVELNGVESTMVSLFLDTVQNETIKTPVIYIPSVKIDNATITLPKNGGNVDVIYKCEYFDLGGFNCLNWIKTDIPFKDLGDKIEFNVNSFSAYAGGLLSSILYLKLGQKQIETRNFRPYSGGYMLALTPLQYLDDGNWYNLQPINNLTDQNYSKLIVKPNYNVLVSRDTKRSLMQLKANGDYINYALEDALYTNAEIVDNKDNQTIIFRNIQNNIDLRYTLMESEIKEDIILNSLTKNRFRFILDAKDVKFEKENGTYKLFNSINDTLDAVLLKPFMYDSNNKISEDVQVSLNQEDIGLVLEVIADNLWLQSASYPVIIDPSFSIIANSTNAFSCATDNVTMDCRSSKNTINLSTNKVAVLDFNLSNLNIPSGQNITDVILQLYCQGTTPGTLDFVNVSSTAKAYNETANFSGMHREIRASSIDLNKSVAITACNDQLINFSFSNNGTKRVRDIYRNNAANLRYFPIGINHSTSILPMAFSNELNSSNSPVLFFNTSAFDSCGNLEIPGVYTLTQDVNAPGTCFNITASNVELNCAGFQINYSHKSLGFGINASGVSNVTVRNCDILQGANLSNAHAIIFGNITNTSFLNNTIFTIGVDAYGFTDESSNTFASSWILIDGSNITSGDDAINIFSAENVTITNNNITRPSEKTGEAIRLTGPPSSNFTIKSNVIYSARSAIVLQKINKSTIDYNNITLNGSSGADGITTGVFSSHTVITNNNITFVRFVNSGTGIDILDSADFNATNNSIALQHPAMYGIRLRGESYRHKIVTNLITGNGTGINLLDDVDFNVLENNTINITGLGSDDLDSIVLDGAGNTFPENNNLTNNTIVNVSRYNLVFLDAGINGTRLIDQPIRNYSFTGIGGTLIVVNRTFGEIFFFTGVNGSGNGTASLIGFANSDIQIGNNSIFVNDSRNPGLNRSANITIFGTPGQPFTNPVILRNGVTCNATTSPSCSNFTSLKAATVIFNVSGFSNYSIGNATAAAGTNNTVINSNINNSNVTNSVIQNSTITNSTVADTFTNQSTMIINSTVLRSNLTNSTALNSLIDNSTLANTTVDYGVLNRTTAFNSTIINATITNSTIRNSVIQNSTITNVTFTDGFSNFSTQISDSTIINSTTLNSTITNSTIQNFTIINSTIDQSFLNLSSLVTNSTIINATLLNDTIRNSVIQNSTIINSTILNSNVNMTFTINSTIINSTKFNSTNLHCIVLGSNETHVICQSSNLTNSNLTKSTVNNSQILNSTITNGTLINSNITLSTITNSTIINSTIMNSTIVNSTITNSTIINSTIMNATITGQTITNLIHLDGCANLNTFDRTYSLISPATASGICFNITVNNVELNCNGFRIVYGGTSSGIGINITSSVRNATIRNCNIVKSSAVGANNFGILLQAQNTTIVNTSILTNGTSDNYAIYLLNSANNTIENVTILTNGSSNNFGIFIDGTSDNNTIRNASISTNGTSSDAFRFNTSSPRNNIIANNTLESIAGIDLNLSSSGINFTTLLNQPIRTYDLAGSGGILIIVNSSFGEIRFLTAVNGTGTNLFGNATSDIIIRNNLAFVNDTRNPGLNRSANITLFGTPGAGFTTPVILRKGIQCTPTTTPSCFAFTSLAAATVIFNVSAFSDYSIGEGAGPEAPSGAPAAAPAPAAVPPAPAPPAPPAAVPPAPAPPAAIIEAIEAEKGPVASASETIALESFINLSIFARKETIPLFISYKEGDIVITVVNRSILSFTTVDLNPSYNLNILPEAVVQTFMRIKEVNSVLLERVPSNLKDIVLNILTQNEYPRERLGDLKAFIKDENSRLEKEINDAEEKLKILKDDYEEGSIKASKALEASIESKKEFDLSKEPKDLDKASKYFNLLKKLSVEENNLAVKAARAVENLDALKVVNELIINLGSVLGLELKVAVKPVEEEKIIVEKFEREEAKKIEEELKISREVRTDLLNKIEGLSREFIDSKLKVGLTANVLVLFGKNYKMDLIKLDDGRAILKLKGLELKLNLGEPVLVDLNNDGRYEALILYKQKVSKDVANIIIREIPIDLQKEILKSTEEAKKEIERQEGLETEIKNVLDTTVAVNFALDFFIKDKDHQLTIKKATEEYVTILFNDNLYNIGLNKPVKLDLDRDNVLDSIVTYEKFFNENVVKLKIDEIIELKEEVNKELLEYQEGLPVSTKPLYDSFAALTSHARVFSLYDKNYVFNLKDVDKDKIRLNIENQDYPINIGQPIRVDVNGDDSFDISVTYERFINDETVKLKIEQITGFGSITSLAVKDISPKIEYVIFAVIIVAVLMFIFSLILWFIRSSRRF